MRVTAPTPSAVSSVSEAAGLLWTNGRRSVRSRWITRVCVHMDSTNQPVWNTSANSARWSGVASASHGAPATSGHTIQNRAAKVRMSKTELTGPSPSMKLTMPRASQVRGRAKNELSTRSQGSATQLTVYAMPSRSSCRALMGKNGKNAAATSTERTLPKLELAVVLMYLMVLP